ncbi:inter-alpha-trypsin inhibitor heavy chain H4 [Patella vulgata]|uniref:inter-alpha-trypsin inhibitor heavy chain H4 n=1 Tax=Patella vulgata TaxID=6465 RepID=UPI0024A8F919|nr:inter-alpha-trypsin inhibitor heavy chain H4 [Patella vulgata]
MTLKKYIYFFSLLFLTGVVGGHLDLVVFEPSNARKRRSTDDNEVSQLLPNITDMYINSNVYSRFATVEITSNVVNQHARGLDATFTVQIPESAFIANFSMIVNNTMYIAKLFAKEEAQKKYDDAKDRGQSAGQVRHASTDPKRGMDIFKVDVNVGSFADATFYLTYQELLERRLGDYQQRIVVQPGQVVTNLTVSASYREEQQFKKFSYRLPNSNVINTASTENAVLSSSTDKKSILYKPSVTDQTASGLDGEIVVTYDLLHNTDGGVVIVEDEYFVHYVAPSGLKNLDKTILFIIDISGSMHGKKISQARDAMLAILDKLNTNDFFNILVFDDQVDSWMETPVLANAQHIDRAKGYVMEYVKPQGSTNINDAMLRGISSLEKSTEVETASRVNAIVLLTDGNPTAGETVPKNIRKNVYFKNKGLASIFCLGFGFDVEISFLKAMAWENGGFARRIYEDVDAVKQLEDFYLEIKDPVLKDLVIGYGNNVDLQSTTRRHYDQYYEGSEIIVAGRTYFPNSLLATEVSIVGISKDGKVDLSLGTSAVKVRDHKDAFTEKLWAYQKIKDLLRIAAIDENASNATSLALNMSLKYNFVTSLTSLVIIQQSDYSSDSISDETRLLGKAANTPFGFSAATFIKPSPIVFGISLSNVYLLLCAIQYFGI